MLEGKRTSVRVAVKVERNGKQDITAGRRDGWMDGQMDGWTDGWMVGWVLVRYKQIGGWMDGWTDTWTDGWLD